SPLQPFYSRKIISPQVALKLTGKIGKNTFGFLVASDRAPGNFSQDERGELLDCQRARATDPPTQPRACANEDLFDKKAYFGVLRLKHDFGKENNIGFFATARVFPRDRNFVSGIDAKLKLDPKTTMTFQV